MLSAAHVGVELEWGPRSIFPGYVWYESDQHSGSTLYLLPENAPSSPGKWNSPLLEAAYNRGQPLPDLYTGAPAWVNDTVLSSRHRNGLLTFCFWSANDHRYRGTTHTFDELDDPTPQIWTPDDETVQAMTSQTGPGTEDQCRLRLTAVSNRAATARDVMTIFTNHSDANVDAAINQPSLAGLPAP